MRRNQRCFLLFSCLLQYFYLALYIFCFLLNKRCNSVYLSCTLIDLVNKKGFTLSDFYTLDLKIQSDFFFFPKNELNYR